MLFDGYVFGVVGFHMSDTNRLVSDEMMEQFGFSTVLEKYPTRNRLLMMCISCTDFRDWALRNLYQNMPLVTLNGFKTTCLTKYRKAKQNNNLLKIRKREKMPNGMYKISYYTPWHERTWSECIDVFLTELDKGAKI